MQSEADKQFQQNVLNFKETLQRKATWEDLEAYVGCKLERGGGGKFKAFILAYLNRDFEPLDFDDGRQYYYAQKVHRWLDEDGHLKACWGTKDPKAAYYKNNKDAIREQQAAYRKNNKDVIKKQKATYYENNKDAMKKYRTTYYRNNKELLIKQHLLKRM